MLEAIKVAMVHGQVVTISVHSSDEKMVWQANGQGWSDMGDVRGSSQDGIRAAMDHSAARVSDFPARRHEGRIFAAFEFSGKARGRGLVLEENARKSALTDTGISFPTYAEAEEYVRQARKRG